MSQDLFTGNKFRIIPDFLDEPAASFPEKIALVCGNSKHSYRDLKEKSEQIGSFVEKNTKKGDAVGVLMQNAADFLVSYFGVLRAGRVVLLLPTNISESNLLFQISKVKPKLIFSEEKFSEKLLRSGAVSGKLFFVQQIYSQEDIAVSRRIASPEDISTIIFTSGTTGMPKGIKLQHQNVISATANITKFLRWQSKDIDVNVASLAHSFGIGNIHCVFAAGGTSIVYSDALNVKEILKIIEKYQATTLSLTPATLRIIADHFMVEFAGGSKSLRFIQTNMSRLEESLIRKIVTNLPKTEFHYYYGLTEASRSAFITLNQHMDKLASVGRPSPNVEIKIVGEDGLESLPGVAGEICIKGKMVVKEYWDEEETQKSIINGWLHTNDLGHFDDEGYLYVTGRNDDIINVSGEKVNPEEIESVIKKVEGVDDALVIGLQDKILGEMVSAYIVVNTDDFDVQGVIKECRKCLESYKVPRRVSIVERIPRTDNGKIQRSLFKKLLSI